MAEESYEKKIINRSRRKMKKASKAREENNRSENNRHIRNVIDQAKAKIIFSENNGERN